MYDRKCRNKKIGGYIIKRIRNRKNRQRVVRDSPAFYILILIILNVFIVVNVKKNVQERLLNKKKKDISPYLNSA